MNENNSGFFDFISNAILGIPYLWLLSLAVFLIFAYKKLYYLSYFVVLSIILLPFNLSLLFWLPFWAISVLLVFPNIRQKILTPFIIFLIRNLGLLPKISQTEKIALTSGTTWVDGELFSGNPDFKKIMEMSYPKLTQEEQDTSVDFADLLEMCALAVPHMRIRYSTSHPRDINEKVVYTMAKYNNLCNYIHLPAQSGNSRILDLMSRNYSREWYMDKIRMIRNIIPDCGISCDIISGFCSETEEEHQDTLSLIEWANFEFSYMYIYSERPGTPAAKKLADDVPDDVKSRRLTEIIALQNGKSKQKNASYIGKVVTVLIEGHSKKSNLDWKGRSDQNSVTIFPCESYQPGDLVDVLIERSTTTAMIGKAIGYASL